MITTAEQTFEKLKNADIDYQLYQHPPVHTVEDANLYCQHISGAHVKNLCLCNKKKTFFCLLTVPDYKRVDLKNFAEQLMHSRFSFVNGNKLFELLGVYPGAVSPLCLLNDSQQQFHFFMDADLQYVDRINIHPMDNQYTINIAMPTFINFLSTYTTINFIALPT